MTPERIGINDIKEGPNYEIWHTPKISQEQFGSFPVREKLIYLATLGHMAPSSHNTQPWAFSILEKGSGGAPLSIYLDRSRVLPASDVRGRQAMISIGAVLGNIQIASLHFGLKTNIYSELLDPEQVKPYGLSTDKTSRYVKICKVSFSASDPFINDNLYNAIFTRRVNRNITDTSQKMPQELVISLKAQETTGTHLYMLKAGDPRITLISELQGQADAYVANSKKFSGELGDWLQENETKEPVGMPGDTFGMDDIQSRHTKYALQGKEKLSANDVSAFSRTSTSGIRTASVVGIITVDKDIPSYWVKSGELLGKIGLSLTAQGLTYAVHAGLAEVSLTRLGLQKAVFAQGTPAILFRAGYPKNDLVIPPHSPRLQIEDVLVKPDLPTSQT